MIQRIGEAENITTHYLFALGAYRALYIPNWMYRKVFEDYFDPISVMAGLIQVYSPLLWRVANAEFRLLCILISRIFISLKF